MEQPVLKLVTMPVLQTEAELAMALHWAQVKSSYITH